MMQPAYITIERQDFYSDLSDIGYLAIAEFETSSLELKIIEDNEDYLVLHLSYYEHEDIQEVVSTISYILVSEGILRFSINININE